MDLIPDLYLYVRGVELSMSPPDVPFWGDWINIKSTSCFRHGLIQALNLTECLTVYEERKKERTSLSVESKYSRLKDDMPKHKLTRMLT